MRYTIGIDDLFLEITKVNTMIVLKSENKVFETRKELKVYLGGNRAFEYQLRKGNLFFYDTRNKEQIKH